MFYLSALLEYKTALLEYIDLFVLDVLMYSHTSNQGLENMVESKPHLSQL